MKNKSKTVVVKVTALDIKSGIREDATSCPIAWALKRHKNQLRFCSNPHVEVTPWGIELDYPEPDAATLKLPAKAKKFIERFDADMPVKPFSFRILL